MNKVLYVIGIALFVGIVCSSLLIADEGMYPISMINTLDLKAKGLAIEPSDIFNPDEISLIDGICNVGGCSGSFVSDEGLILTNHHCAYGAIQRASTTEHDYLQNGFMAEDRSTEVQAKGYTVRITESYRDVSDEVLSAVKEEMNLAERTKAIEKKMKEIVADIEKENPGKRASVSEMFPGKTYVLFIYTYLKDIRLVYAPPQAIGNFGGEEDNWIWPRHTGDFSFMRAYVAPDGSPADYSKDNVPYTPKRVIKVAPDGVNDEDFVFILGYPGRTYRHRTSHFLAYHQHHYMPYVVEWYQWMINEMEKMSEQDRTIALKHVSMIKGLSNVMKNYRGKLIGLKRLNLLDKKRYEEQELQEFINADQKRKENYGAILSEFAKVYDEMTGKLEYELALRYLLRNSTMLSLAYRVYEGSIELQKPDLEREAAYMKRNFANTKRRMQLSLQNYYEPTDKIVLKEMLMRASRLQSENRLAPIVDLIGDKDAEDAIDEFIAEAYAKTGLAKEGFAVDAMQKNPEEVQDLGDPFIDFAGRLYVLMQEQKEIDKARKGALDKLYAQLIDVKQEFLATDFIPDANSTLRLTYGYIRGYEPKDAVYYSPITTLQGVVEKTTGEDPFISPQKLLDLAEARDFGRFEHPKLKSVPVAILYNMDTTGGNSGSAVFNARGELVGVNFDRAFEATINDFAWSESYSRSIAVDIRYVLWITQKYGGATYLLKEMQVLDAE